MGERERRSGDGHEREQEQEQERQVGRAGNVAHRASAAHALPCRDKVVPGPNGLTNVRRIHRFMKHELNTARILAGDAAIGSLLQAAKARRRGASLTTRGREVAPE